MIRCLLVLVLSLVAVSCKDSNKGSSDGGVTQQQNRVPWNSIPAELNPRIFEENFNTENANRIFVDMFGFDKDVEVVYSSDLARGQGYLKIYTVSYGGANTSSSFHSRIDGKNLNLYRNGSYQCSIRIQNQKITELEGHCYIRLQIFLPVGAEIEVYNMRQLLTRRFIAMDNETFLKNFKDASFAEGKKAVVEEYLSSYRAVNRRPALFASEIGTVVSGFSWKEEKLEYLRKLQAYTIDRENLGQMIEKSFSYFEREEARKICGL